LVATGSHLDPAQGNTVDAIVADGFGIGHRVPLERRGDGPVGVADAMARAISGITCVLNEIAPDMLLLLGDRYEIFAAAQAATISAVPIAHIAGGDVSEGANDDAMRHAITKLSHLHFATNPAAAKRIRQMGEDGARIFNSGSPGIDNLISTPRLDRAELESRLGFGLRRRNLAVCIHPATLDPLPAEAQVAPLLAALADLPTDTGLIFTAANADAGGNAINAAIAAFVAQHDNACFTASLGQAGYYSLLAVADLVVGNSSSGLYEAPSLHTPTLDIGIRQRGRLRGPSVRHADNDQHFIAEAISAMLEHPPRDFHSPYGDGHASERIVDALLAIDEPSTLLHKRFAELP
jgi:UDP-N-acetylglucosamine 2-epimerase (non-hydrolysing)/GDP/UDP-N,N'-diacetylbacillosamine 2-epimerase (hydrolysing)